MAKRCASPHKSSQGADVRFEWDEPKARINLWKHEVSFEKVKGIYKDPLHMFMRQFHDGEWRWKIVGWVETRLAVVIAEIMEDEEGELIRIISARWANKFDRKSYEDC